MIRAGGHHICDLLHYYPISMHAPPLKRVTVILRTPCNILLIYHLSAQLWRLEGVEFLSAQGGSTWTPVPWPRLRGSGPRRRLLKALLLFPKKILKPYTARLKRRSKVIHAPHLVTTHLVSSSLERRPAVY